MFVSLRCWKHIFLRCCLFTPREKSEKSNLSCVGYGSRFSALFHSFCSKRILFISLRNIKVSSFLLGIHLTHSHFHDSSSKRSGKDFRSTDCSFHLTPLSMVQWKFHPFSFSLIFWQRCETFLWQQNMNTEKARRKSFAMFPRSGIRIDADSQSHFCRFTAAACSLFSVFTMR